ncbi:MarR family transcriptional regulator [Rubripirellula amarantea]|nr:MarR family transcriptional regulator [Rubripirellula amarantea]
MAPITLRQQLGKRGPFESLEQEAMLSILRTSDLLENRLARLLRDHDLTPSQYNALRIMRGEGKPMPCLEVAQRMIQVAPAITRVVDQLVAKGLASKEQSVEDRRVYLVEITKPGLRVLSKLDEPIQTMHQTLLGHVPKSDLKMLNAILQATREGIAE